MALSSYINVGDRSIVIAIQRLIFSSVVVVLFVQGCTTKTHHNEVLFLPRNATKAQSVRPSATFVNSAKTSNHIFNFSPSGSQTILVSWQYSDGDLPNGGIEFRWGRQKSRF